MLSRAAGRRDLTAGPASCCCGAGRRGRGADRARRRARGNSSRRASSRARRPGLASWRSQAPRSPGAAARRWRSWPSRSTTCAPSSHGRGSCCAAGAGAGARARRDPLVRAAAERARDAWRSCSRARARSSSTWGASWRSRFPRHASSWSSPTGCSPTATSNRSAATCSRRPRSRDEERRRRQAELTDTRRRPARARRDRARATLRVLQALGVEPELTAGHSYGEFVALAAAGGLDEEHLLRISEARGRFMSEAAGDGRRGDGRGRCAGPDPAPAPLLDGAGVVLANLNAPRQTVLSGPREQRSRRRWSGAASTTSARGRCRSPARSTRPTWPARSSAWPAGWRRRRSPRRAFPVFSNTTASRLPRGPRGDRATAVAPPRRAGRVRATRSRPCTRPAPASSSRSDRDSVLTGLVGRILGDATARGGARSTSAGGPGWWRCCTRSPRSPPRACRSRRRGCSADGAPARLDLRTLQPPGGPHARSATTWLVNGGAPDRPAEPPLPIDPAPPLPTSSEVPMSHANGTPNNGRHGGDAEIPPPAGFHPAERVLAGRPSPAGGAPPRHTGSGPLAAVRHAGRADRRRAHRRGDGPPSPVDAAVPGHAAQRHARLPARAPRAAGPARGHRPVPPPARRLCRRRSRPPAPAPQGAAARAGPACPPPRSRCRAGQPAGAAARSRRRRRPRRPRTPAAAAAPAPGPRCRAERRRRRAPAGSRQRAHRLPAEMLDLDVDLESDLGIDSIKRVEIAGTMVQDMALPDGVELDVEELTASRTLRRGHRRARAPRRRGPHPAGVPAPVGEPRRRGSNPSLLTQNRSVGASAGSSCRPPAPRRSPALTPDAELDPTAAVVIVDDGHGVGRAAGPAAERRRPPAVVCLPRTPERRGRACSLEAAARAMRPRGRARAPRRARAARRRPTSALWLALPQAVREDLEHAAVHGGAAVLGATRMGGAFAIDGPAEESRPARRHDPGFLKSLAHEWPGVRVKAVDLDAATPAELAEPCSPSCWPATASSRSATARVQRRHAAPRPLRAARASAGAIAPPLDAEAVVLVTGGARGITAETADRAGRALPVDARARRAHGADRGGRAETAA